MSTRRDSQHPRLRVAVDAWNLPGDHRGIGRYVRAIVDSWLRREAGRLQLTLVIPEWPAWVHAARYRAEIGNGGIAVCERRAATAQNFDAVWFPWNGMSWTTDAPAIATLHDASLFALPVDDAAWTARERKPFEAAAAGARKILTDSAFSKSELARHVPIAPERIAVVLLGVDASPPPAGKLERFEGIDRYLLFVGEPEQRKGLDTLADAIALMPPQLQAGLGIVIAGKGTDDVPLGEIRDSRARVGPCRRCAAVRAVRGRGSLHLPFPLRRLRIAGARGDGARRAGHRVGFSVDPGSRRRRGDLLSGGRRSSAIEGDRIGPHGSGGLRRPPSARVGSRGIDDLGQNGTADA